MLSFAKKNPRAFVNNNFEIPALCALLKILGAIFALWACTTIMLISDNVIDIVQDYASIAIISQIDDFIGQTVPNHIYLGELKVLITQERMRKSDWQVLDEFWNQNKEGSEEQFNPYRKWCCCRNEKDSEEC